MKKLLTPALIFVYTLLNIQVHAQLPAVVKDWAKFAGNQDSVFKTPVVTDGDKTYVATFTVDSLTGADILIVNYDGNGDTVWTQTWTGGGEWP